MTFKWCLLIVLNAVGLIIFPCGCTDSQKGKPDDGYVMENSSKLPECGI